MRHCAVCGKTSKMGGTRKLLRGHYNPTNWTRKYPNLQLTLTPDGERLLACTQCIRTFSKAARLEKKKALKTEAAQKATVAAPVAEKKAEEPKAEKAKAPKKPRVPSKNKKEPKAKKTA